MRNEVGGFKGDKPIRDTKSFCPTVIWILHICSPQILLKYSSYNFRLIIKCLIVLIIVVSLYQVGIKQTYGGIRPPEGIKQLISDYSRKYGVSEALMTHIVQAESTGSTTIQSNYYHKGKRENSWGLVQINLDWNPEVTKEEALDPNFSLNFLASNLKKGKCKMWSTCPLMS